MLQNLSDYVQKYQALKKELLEHKLTDLDAGILAARFLEVPANSIPSLFFDIKNSADFRTYQFLASGMVIKKVEFTGIEARRGYRIAFTLQKGSRRVEFSFAGKQAMLLIVLLKLKFSQFQQDAEGGFNREIDDGVYTLTDAFGFKNDPIGEADIDNIKAKLRKENFSNLLERANGKTRISVPPHHITFEERAREGFEALSIGALAQFEEKFGLRLFTV